MARALRCLLPDGFFHITARGVDGCPIYEDELDRLRFLRELETSVRRHAWSVHALCLMGNHYHLVLEARCDHLSKGLHRLNGVYAQAFNKRHDRKGRLFGDRFVARVLEDEPGCLRACRYVLLNPVRAGLARTAADWPWTRSRHGLPDALDEHTFGG